MKIYPIETGNFKLDGGGMFGVVPKTIWQRTNPADANNLIDIAARCLLVEEGNKLTLIDTGMGHKQSNQFFGYYSPWGPFNLKDSVKKAGFSMDEVTDVFLSHLHFDHVGGAVQWNKDRSAYEMAFKNAHFWTNKKHWDWATKPNAREKASFLSENILPIKESGQLKLLEGDDFLMKDTPLGFDIIIINGHTEKQMLPVINYKNETVVFAADLIPTAGHLPVPYVMGYDTRPLLTLEEKKRFLSLAEEKKYLLFLEHDAHNELISLRQTEKGIRLNEQYRLNSFF